MCGILAVVTRPSTRTSPSADEVAALLDAAAARWGEHGIGELAAVLDGVSELVERADRLLRGVAGARCLIDDPSGAARIERAAAVVDDVLLRADRRVAEQAGHAAASTLEVVNAALVRLRDAAWAVRDDRLRTARAVADLAGRGAPPSAIEAYWSVQIALSGLDRLEVRGRDSAGLQVLVTGHGLDPARVRAAGRDDPVFGSMAIRASDGCLAFVYKAAAEIGEYGDNTRVLRDAIRSDDLLRAALSPDGARATVLAHTRWASVGIISEANAHPLDDRETGDGDSPYVAAVLNGDVDNYADLRARDGLSIANEITTDAKVIPALVSRRLREGNDLQEAFRRTVSSFEGSVAVAAVASQEPGRLSLALRGSGQALYVGLAQDATIVASEPYGLVEEATRYVRLDGETLDESGTRGQIVVLEAERAGIPEGVLRLSYAGAALTVADREWVRPDVTTRDVARGDFQHYLLKEISESPLSFRKTLRGRVVERDGRLTTTLGPETLPEGLVAALAAGAITQIYVIGQGTAAIAAQGMAASLGTALTSSVPRVEAMPTSELSGFHMRDDMSDTLVVAISQSGTSADTNRSVDLTRERGAWVVAIVNRRGSDLCDKAHGVMYTSDGRDIEMAVPSTKAFYAQIAAGVMLAFAIADACRAVDPAARHEMLSALRELPSAMEEVLRRRPAIADAAQRHAPLRRNWSIVGSGTNRVAAEEVRIKLSELCYMSISCDATEDKKHIDLSAEPLILVCAAGMHGSNADDVAMEVQRFRAHKSAPIVIASEGDERYTAAVEVLWVPDVHPALAFVLSTMAGHLFGYEAALAIDAQARPLREARAAVEAAARAAHAGADLLDKLAPALDPVAARFFDALRSHSYDGHLEASTAVRVSSMLRYATKVAPLDAYQVEYGRIGTPSTVVEDLTDALTRAIEELTRPVDAIKHQAKTVTVGVSRSDESLLRVPLVRASVEAGAPRDRLNYRIMRTLAALDPAVEEVTGYTRYRIEGEAINVVDKGGVARDIPSRAERDPTLRGTKRRVATEREVWVARGQSDGRSVIIVPEVKGTDTTGVTLLHVRFAERLASGAMRAVLQGYRDRFGALRDAVTETEPSFREDLLEDVPPLELLTEPVYVLARRWRP